jgi:ricin-type beta-trefoil lectin protein/Big-like domain-containing protein
MAGATILLVLQLASACSPDSPSSPSSVVPPTGAVTATLASGLTLIHTRLAPEKCLTIPGSAQNGVKAVIQPCTGATQQQFDFQSNGEIHYGNFCLGTSTKQGKSGENVIIWPCNGGNNQKWSVTSAGEIKGINGLCVDVYAENPADGQPVVINTCRGSLNQQWDIESSSTTSPSSDSTMPPAQQGRLALAFDPTSSLSTSSRIGPTGTAVGTPTYVAGPPARYALDSAEAIDFGSGALDNVWTSSAGWTYIATIETGAKANGIQYILVKENASTSQFAFFRNGNGGLELVVRTPSPNYENVQSVALPDFAKAVVAMRYNPQLPLGQRVKLFINGAPAAEASHTFSGTGGAIAATSARLRMGITERGGYRASPVLGAAYVYNAVLADTEVASNSAWISTNRLWNATAAVPVAAVAVSPASASLTVGGTQQLSATPKDASGNALTGRAVTWASSAPAVASVSGAGLVTAVAAGTATITATSEGISGTASVAVSPPSSGGACNLVTDLNRRAESPFAKPGYLQPVIEPDFGTTITRISGDPGTPIGNGIAGNWPTLVYHNYPKDPVFTADQKLLVLKHMSGVPTPGAALFLDGDTYKPLFSRGGPSGGGEWRLHPTIPDVAVYLNSSGAVGHWNVRTNVSTVKVPAVSGYTAHEMGPSEGGLSYDGRYIVAKGVRSADNHVVARVIDVDGGTTGPVIDMTAAGLVGLDFVTISALGGYVLAYGDFGGGSTQHVRVWSASTGALVGTWNDYTMGHLDLGVDASGAEVVYSAVGQSPYSHHFITRRLSDGMITDLSGAWTSYNWHSGTRNNLRRGWGYSAVNDRTGYPLDGEIFATKLDGSKQIQRLAHHRANNVDYDSAPFPTASPDGKRVVFASNWGASTGRPIQAYVVDVRNICP